MVYSTKDEKGNLVEKTIPHNFVLWSTGIAMNPFTARVANLLPNQFHMKAIEVDAFLRVKGAPLGTVYAVGDASSVSNRTLAKCIAGSDKANLTFRWKRIWLDTCLLLSTKLIEIEMAG